MTDPIADMLTRIRNSSLIGQANVFIPMSKMKEKIAQILENERYIDKFEIVKGKADGDEKEKFDRLRLVLAYNADRPKIRVIKRVSKPGLRKYVTKDTLPVVLNGKGVAIISTSSGLITNKEAKAKKLGGEVICEIY